MEEDVKIMDHQIEDDVHVRAAFEKGMKAVGFDEQRPPHHAVQGRNSRIEPLDKADLEDESLCIGQGDQFVRLGERHGDRFFQKDIHARLEKDRGNLIMGAGRHGDRDGVNHPCKLPVIRHGLAAIEIRRLAGAFRDRVANPDDPAPRYFLIFLQVIVAEVTDTYHADFDVFHCLHRQIPRFDSPDEGQELPDFG